ncbi:hypothetical protein GCM10009760_20760 [Kitasatospora kazusensis]|uniref:Uncharacterized protein n=1 Tax=Kitasatospora kazusensis TaxID=407974 RepID=A0ABP5KXX5_9ACTN
MKKITALAALAMAGLALAASPAHADSGPSPQVAETEAALQTLAGLPLIAPYAADVRGSMQQFDSQAGTSS